MPSPRKRSQKLPLYHTNKRREDPLKILLAWVALLAVASTIWSLLHHHRRSAPEVDIHPSLIHYDARGGALLNINGTEPPEYARRDWQHLGTFRGAKGCLDAARGPGAAPCRSNRKTGPSLHAPGNLSSPLRPGIRRLCSAKILRYASNSAVDVH